MTLAEAREIFAYWQEHPPTHLALQVIARLLGWTPGPVAASPPPADEIAASAPPGLAVIRGGGIGMPTPADPALLRDKNRALALAAARRSA